MAELGLRDIALPPMCVIGFNAPVSGSFVRALDDLSPQYTVSNYPANFSLDSSVLWSGIPDDDDNDYVAGLFEDIKWGYAEPDNGEGTHLSYYLYDGEYANYSSPNDLYGQPLHEKEREAILSSMDAFASVTGLTFAETSDKDEANISFLMMNNDDSDGYLGWANYPGTSPYGDTYSTVNNEVYDLDDDPFAVSPGSYYYLTFTHELGHALGMGHPHDGNTFPGVPYGEYSNGGNNNLNASPWSVLTYNDATATNGLSPGWSSSDGYSETLGAYDIATAQYLYGPNLETNLGDTTYYLDEYTLRGYQTIWDAGGADTIDASNSGEAVQIDLRNATLKNEFGGGGFLSNLDYYYIGYSIAYNSTGDAVIENAVGSANSDHIHGNEVDNALYGGLGTDTHLGGDGDDFLWGQEGDDVFREVQDQISSLLMKELVSLKILKISIKSGSDLLILTHMLSPTAKTC